MKKVALHNLGCKVNAYEMDVMQQMLQEKGYKIVPFEENADIYIINTCTVTNIADRKSRQMLHRAKTKNPDAIVVAVGCYVQTGIEKVEKDPAIDLAIGNNRKKDLIPILEEFMSSREQAQGNRCVSQLIDINAPCEYEKMTLKKQGEHTRAYIKIQDGCNQFCSYCIIPYARGRVRSRNAEDILEEVQGLAGQGCKEIVFTGIHISSYGADLDNGSNLLTLLKKVHEIKGIDRIRLGSLEPRIVTEDFANGLASLSKICPHFHLSLQSGCNATLKRMNRHYTAEEYFECVKRLRKIYDNPAITTDVIVGFPGETEEEFLETKRFLEKVKFYEMHIFRYSRRHGTVADKMENQIPESVKVERSGILLNLEKKQSEEFRKQFVGKEETVLFEETKTVDGKEYQIGHTSRYVKVAKETGEDLYNREIRGRISKFLKNDILLMED